MEILCFEEKLGNIASDFANQCRENVILDLSTMPKRFFFPILTTLLANRIVNLIAAYSHPKRYHDVLSQD